MSVHECGPRPSASADLFLEPPTATGTDQIELSARLEGSNGRTRRIWFRFPARLESMLSRRADPFVVATLIHALGRFEQVRIHGPVSDGLLPNAAEFQAAYAAFHGLSATATQFTASEVAAVDATRTGDGLTAFSGGVDSCFSVLRHTRLSPLQPKRSLAAALMMHGFDIPLSDPGTFQRAASRVQTLTDSAGIALLTGGTNVRELPGKWEDVFGTAVAASLSFFQPVFVFGLIPSAQEWRQLHFDHGSNPLTDPLLSSTSFALVHDGTSFGRIDKLRHLATWPEALRHVRVCWEGANLDTNCGRCEKCLRTLLMLRLCGIENPPAFPTPLDLGALDRLVIETRTGFDEFAYLLREARRTGHSGPWIASAARALARSRRHQWLRARGRSLAALMPTAVGSRLLRLGRHQLRGEPEATNRRLPAESGPLPAQPTSVRILAGERRP